MWLYIIKNYGVKNRENHSAVKNPPANAGDIRNACSIPGLGRCPGGGHGNPLQCSCLKNPMDRGAWQAAVHRIAESNVTEATAFTHLRPVPQRTGSWASTYRLFSATPRDVPAPVLDAFASGYAASVGDSLRL